MSKTLLLADDSVVIQKLVGLSFANEDVEIIATDNGDDAIVKAREVTPDVILADVVMPGKSGYEVCEAIKQDPALAHIPVLLLTGTFEAFDEARAATAGADGQITKPFEAQSLVERVNEVMSAPAPAPAPTAEAEAVPVAPDTSSSADFDFFDSSVSTLSGDESGSQTTTDPLSADQTPTIDVSDDSLFGAPGDGASEELDTLGGGMALGESVAAGGSAESDIAGADMAGPNMASPTIDNDATVVALPEPVTPLPPSQGDPLAAFERDLDLSELPVMTPPAVDLDAALDAAPADPEATIVAGIDDNNAATTPNYDAENVSQRGVEAAADDIFADVPPVDDAFEDLTIHAPSAAIDQAVATATSPTAIDESPYTGSKDAGATIVANLDVDLAEPTSSDAPAAPGPLDLGPSNVVPDDLDFAFDVSEQASVSDPSDGFGESFSSLMNISESQILVGPNSDSEPSYDSNEEQAEAPPIDDSFAAGYDVSVSDLVTASTPSTDPSESEAPPSVTPSVPEPPLGAGDAIEFGSAATNDDLEIGVATATSSSAPQVPDLSPIIEQRIQETLEKVAWEAFSDLSESIVKQVIGRIEQIAWEVIPQMAETLVREEIRKMKGEND